jgi:hypothetical protein
MSNINLLAISLLECGEIFTVLFNVCGQSFRQAG